MASLPVVLTIAWHEYVTNVRRTGFIVLTLLMPALGGLMLLVSAFFSGALADLFRSQFVLEPRPIGVVDFSGLFTPLPEGFSGDFVAYPGEDAARRALLAGDLRGYAVIAEDYLHSGQVTSFSPTGLSRTMAFEPDDLRPLLVSGLLAGQVDAAVQARAADPLNGQRVLLDASGEPERGGAAAMLASWFIPYALAIFLVLAVFNSSGYLLRSVSEEKENRVIEVVLSSVSARDLLAGKVLGLGALGLTQIAIWALASVALSGGMTALLAGAALTLGPQVLVLGTVYFLLGYLVYGTLMATAGALGSNLRESQQLAGIFSFVAAVPWMINGFLFANPNAPVARVLSYFPLTAPTMMMLRLALGEVPVEDIVISIVGLLLAIPVLIWAGARLFRVGLLMYGKRPTLPEIARLLRAG